MLEPTTGPGPAPGLRSAGPNKGLVNRAKDILTTPKTEWPVIDAEPSTIQGIYVGYVAILAAIGPICLLIGSQVFGYSILGVTWRPSLGYAIGQAVISYVLSLVSVYVMALIIDALAPNFGGTKNQLNAFKVSAYSMTAAWVAGVFSIIPMLGILGALAAIYSLYLLYLGLPVLMRVPQDKAITYVVVIIVAAILVYFVIGIIVGALTSAFFGLAGPAALGGMGSLR